MSVLGQQLNFSLRTSHPHSLMYFVAHTGVARAVATLEHASAELGHDRKLYFQIVLIGPAGSGKTHLTEGFRARLCECGFDPAAIRTYDLGSSAREKFADDSWIREFIATYEERRREGGLLVLTADDHPDRLTNNPHVLSRLRAGSIEELSYPKEIELRPLLYSLCERHNLKLSDHSLDYLLRRLPRQPLSFAHIFDKIDELSLSQGRPAKLGVVREALEVTSQKKSLPTDFAGFRNSTSNTNES